MIVADRGFLCGSNLWEIKKRFGIDFLIYSKSNMDMTKELKNKKKKYEKIKEKDIPVNGDCFYQRDEQIEV